MNIINKKDNIDYIKERYHLSSDTKDIISNNTNKPLAIKGNNGISVYISSDKKLTYRKEYLRSVLLSEKLEIPSEVCEAIKERLQLVDYKLIRKSDNKVVEEFGSSVRLSVSGKNYRIPYFVVVNNLLDNSEKTLKPEKVKNIDAGVSLKSAHHSHRLTKSQVKIVTEPKSRGLSLKDDNDNSVKNSHRCDTHVAPIQVRDRGITLAEEFQRRINSKNIFEAEFAFFERNAMAIKMNS